MVVADLEKCVGCGYCQVVCPREALYVWGHTHINRQRCTDCYDGLHQFEENVPLSDRAKILDTTCTLWQRDYIENCPVEALSVESEQPSYAHKR